MRRLTGLVGSVMALKLEVDDQLSMEISLPLAQPEAPVIDEPIPVATRWWRPGFGR